MESFQTHNGSSVWSTYPYVVPAGIHLRFESRFALNRHLLLLLFQDSDLIGERRLGSLQKFLVITTVKPYCHSCPAMQSKRRDVAEEKIYTLAYTQSPYLCSTVIKRMIVMTTADPYCPTCTSLHAPRLPTQRLTSQLCMHDELCISTESTLRNHVTLRGAQEICRTE